MKVNCLYNNISSVDKKLHDFSFDQDENGDIDITVGKSYDVYGIKENSFGRFYLVLTDELNSDMPWWMPAGLYEVGDSQQPREWIKKEKDSQDEKLVVHSYPIYFEGEEDIEDSTEKGFEIFAKMREVNEKDNSI